MAQQKSTTTFYKRFRMRSIGLIVLIQCVVGLLVAVWAVNALAFGVHPEQYFLLFGVPFILLEIIAIVFTFLVVGEPAKLMSEAIAHTTQQTNIVPPDLSHKRYKQTGLRNIIQSVYEMPRPTPAPVPETDESESVFANAFENLPVGVILLDASHTILYANSRAPIHQNGTTLDSLALQFDPKDTLTDWLAASEKKRIKATRSWNRLERPTSKVGEERQFYDLLASYEKSGSGGVEILIVTVDRTAEYAPDEEAMDFIALAAHELRGPVTVIHGYLDDLSDELKGTLTNEQKALMERLVVSASRLSGYINNILNASRYDRRHLKLRLHEHALSDIYASVATDLELRARTMNRQLTVSIPSDLPTVAAEKNSIGEVITNLVDNAIKYSNENGEVIVGAEVEGDFVSVSVQDFGIGMPSHVVDKLFTKFYRSHRSREQTAGSGLGLYISKAIVESHGGTMSVRSTEGHGSTFTFTLPIYSTVAEKLRASHNDNEDIIESSNGWIKNHSMYRG